jgi:hypothetical protein
MSLFCSYIVFGCAFATGLRQDVPITTNVPGALIFIDGSHFGVTTVNGPPLIANLKKSKSSLGILDLVGGAIILIPIITLITGHAYELEPDALYLPLDPLIPEKPQ